MKKDYTALLSSNVWPTLENKLLAGIQPSMKESMRVILANTRQALIADGNIQNLVYLPKIVLPLVRRLFPKLIANQIISTQPLTGPTGWIRFLDSYLQDVDGNPIANGTTFTGTDDGNIYPWSSGDTAYSLARTAVNDNVLADAGANSETNFNGTLSEGAMWSEGTLFLEVGNAATVAGSTTFTKIGEVDKNGVLHQLGSTVIMGVVNPKSGVYVVNFGVAPSLGIKFTYKKDIQKNIPFGTGKSYPTMKFDITKMAIEAKTRKLGATYSFELLEDYKNEFGENFEDKMVDYLTTTILTEIDGETLSLLYNKATESDSWDMTLPLTWTRGVNAWYETIMPKINKLSNTIYQKTHVSGATFMVCSPVTATVFQSMGQFTSSGNPIDTAMDVGSVKAGTLGGMYNVYTSPLAPDGYILMGFKGSKPEDTGAIYAPYIPVQLHPIYYAEGQPSVMARSRYWMGVVRPDYYGVLQVTGS